MKDWMILEIEGHRITVLPENERYVVKGLFATFEPDVFVRVLDYDTKEILEETALNVLYCEK